MLSEEKLIERIHAVNPVPNDGDTGFSAEALLSTINERSGLMQTQTKKNDEPTREPTKTRRGLLVAAAAFVMVILAGALFLLIQPESDVASDPTTTTQVPTTVIESRGLEGAMVSVMDVATEAGYEAAVEPWDPQLVFVTGGPDCQIDSDTVRFAELDTLTTERAMVGMTLGDSVGSIEVLRFADPAVAEAAVPIFERLLKSRRECITDGLTSGLGNAFRNPVNETIDADGALGAFLFTYEHDDGSGRVAYVQVLGAIEGDLMYVISFRSNTGPVDTSLLEDLFLVVRDGTA